MTVAPFPLLVVVPVRSAHEATPLFLSRLDDETILERTLADAERQAETGDVTLLVTTDDPRIVDVASSRETGWHVRLRDEAETRGGYFYALDHATAWASKTVEKDFRAVLVLEPSHPFRPAGLIANALEQFVRSPELETVVAVVREYGNLWTDDEHQGLRRIHTPAGRNFFREVAGLCFLTRPAAMNTISAMGVNVGFVVVEDQWALIDIHDAAGVELARRFHSFPSFSVPPER